MARRSDWAYMVRQAVTEIRDANFKLQAAADEYNAAGYFDLSDDDLQGVNEGIAAADIITIMGTTAPAIEALMDAGHATNIDKVRL